MADVVELAYVHADPPTMVAQAMSAALGVTLSLRESLYRGGEYFYAELPDGTALRVQHNVDLDELAEPAYADAATVVYASMPRWAAATVGALLRRIDLVPVIVD
ncbi:hypothetical protein [Pilimelia columellifera]|uniref:Uncharacterized protein n=1 Tax=Pilimelia columellifera subsp. columellifera TaxID=706583 RepID=A0ABN3NQK0_9ACTN